MIKIVLMIVAVSHVLIWLGLSLSEHYPKCAVDQFPPKRQSVKWHTVDLDRPPEERWREIMQERGAVLRSMMAKIKTFIRQVAFNSSIPVELIDYLMPKLGNEIQSPYKEEMQGIAKYGQLPYGEVVLYNLFYDLNPLCTSIVAQDENGTIYHARNLDYGSFHYKSFKVNMTEELRNGVVNVRFMKAGKVQFVVTTYVGYAGVTTGMKPGKFTLSLNARHPSPDLRFLEVLEWILGRRQLKWFGPLSRDVMENSTSYQHSLTMLASSELIAAAYYIVGGTRPGEGCIVTRSPTKADDLCLNATAGRWYVLETNFDHWKTTPESDRRRAVGQHCMNETTAKNIGFAGLYNVLSTRPVLAPATTFTTLMQASKGRYTAYVRYPDSPVP